MSRYRPVRYLPGEVLLALYRRRGAVINSGIGRHGFSTAWSTRHCGCTLPG
jgi:hypothetical protein